MFARDALLPWRTAVRNVEYGLELRQPKLTRSERRERALKLLSNLGVDGNAAKRYPWQLSQGMRQRVALARTWALAPELLLMDEPFAALDAQTRADAQEQFLDIWAQSNKTVIFVTHDLSEAILLGDRVIAMDQGRLVAEAEVDIPRPRNPNDDRGRPEVPGSASPPDYHGNAQLRQDPRIPTAVRTIGETDD